ncbi:MAG: magnesium/cobalt transporter CorA [Pseudomonadota bacterium]
MFMKRRSRKQGLPPGSLIHIGERRSERTNISVIEYGETAMREIESATLEQCGPPQDAKSVAWIDVEGLNEVGVLEKIGERFGLHPLVLEDILNTDQRPKMEDYGSYIYIVLRMLCPEAKGNGIISDQVSIILGANFVISFQEGKLDVFDPVRARIKGGKGRLRTMGASYLAYALVDSVVDRLFTITEKFGDEIDDLEDALLGKPSPETLHRIHALKKDLLFLRRAVWPLRELIGGLQRGESELVGEHVRMYLRDVYDHVAYLIDTVETFRDMLSGMLDIYLSSINNRMNEVIKVLTMIATIFMPLTFIAGVYGMNFKFMPELDWRYGYPAVWAAMISVTLAMFAFFRKKRWI